MLTRRIRKKGGLIFVALLFLAGCSAGEKESVPLTLLTCGNRVVTEAEYHDALKLALHGYPYASLSRKDDVAAIRQGVLNQLREELLLLRVADEKGVALDNRDLEKAVRDAREGYPEGAFEQELTNRGITLEIWRRRLAKRLLVEKILKTEFGNDIYLTYDDFQAVRLDSRAGLSEKGLVRQVKRTKMETAYRRWQQRVAGKYSIEVNGELWEKILEEDRP